jgi:hypothetical protein
MSRQARLRPDVSKAFSAQTLAVTERVTHFMDSRSHIGIGRGGLARIEGLDELLSVRGRVDGATASGRDHLGHFGRLRPGGLRLPIGAAGRDKPGSAA